ncbi:3-oxoacyl-[acyl-carrier-protein] synthase III C-terminal domain-containing protein [Streptomyces sp. NPDC003860]
MPPARAGEVRRVREAADPADLGHRVPDAATGRLRATLIGHRHAVVSLAFSADGAMIATASDDTTIRLWSARTGRPLAVLSGHGWEPGAVDFCVSHTGRPLIMDGVEQGLGLKPDTLRHSRESMAQMGNTSSASVLDVLRRHHEDGSPEHGSRGVIVAFGPGFTTEVIAGSWHGR